MKITNVTCYPISEGRSGLFVVVDTDEGLYGVGESGVSSRPLAVMGAVEHFKEILIGADPFRIGHLWQLMSRGGFFPGKSILSSAQSAIDIALWDIKGKALNVPIYELLGGRQRDKVVGYPHCQTAGDGSDPGPLVDSCQQAVDEGWKFVRWGLPLQGDICEPRVAVRNALRQFEAVRNALGPEIDICFDVHTRLDLADVVTFCRQVEQYDPFFIEDPLRSENPDSFKTLRPRTSVPLAAGEQFGSKFQFRQLIEEEWIDYARTDLCIVGGITETMKIAGWAETHYIKLATHNPLGPVSSAACLQVNLACANLGVQEQPRRPGTSMLNSFPVQVEWEDGYLLPPERPGLGIEFDRQAAEAHRWDPSQTRGGWHLTRRLDGSFTNW